MKKILISISIVALFLMSSCAVNTSGNVNIDAEDIKYVKDERTGLCFGVVASRKAVSASTTGLGVTCVPCEAVEKYLED